MVVVVGGVVEKGGKYLLVQEAKEKCYKKWNIPSGHLEENELLIDGAKREIKEETGCDVGINEICAIENKNFEGDIFIGVIFKTKLLKDNIKYDTNEILDVKWFSYEEILKMKENLRSNYIIRAIENCRKNTVAPIEILNK